MTDPSVADPPIACTLSADELPARLERIARLARRALIARSAIPDGEVLTFAAGVGVEYELEAIVAAEARCCAFLRFELKRDADELHLSVTGPQGSEAIIGGLFA